MKFSQSTINILKNFVTINQGIHFRKGNTLTSVHPNKVIVGKAILEDQIPQDFVIANLNSFLGVISLLKDPDFEFRSDKVVLKHGNASVNYGFCDPSYVKSIDQKIELPEDVQFDLSAEELESVRKASSIMILDYIKVEGDGENISVVAYDPKDPSTNTFIVATNIKSNKKFNAIFKVSNLQIVPGNYSIGVSLKDKLKVGHFQCKDHKVEYWVALETGSKLV